MKIKDLEKTANVAWSPKNYSKICLAAGTAGQQLDASFETNAALEIYSLNLSEHGLDMKQVCSFPSEQRFHRIIWSAFGDQHNAGTIIGGCDGGLIKIYDASRLLKNENGFITQKGKHIGPVHALDSNSFQHNLFATGAGESEIFIWDMNNLETPMTPGSKSQPLEDVVYLSWNKQVQHILASTFPSKCVIWDLRKNEPIIKLTDTVSRVRWKVVAWHPEVATQLCLASEEDHSPVIQIWDLRFATSPLKTLANHERGVLSLAWCSDDADLLISCGKDNRILCWNPSSDAPNGEVLSEIARTNQWNFDIVWCPKNPAIIACPSFDGHVSVYSLMGGKVQQFQTTNKIADSFPGMDNHYMQAPITQNLGPISLDLAKPPKWLKRPVGASFSLGGKLVTFENKNISHSQLQANSQNGNTSATIKRKIDIFQVITEPELTKKSLELENVLQQGNFIEYCKNKADDTKDQNKKYIWHFIRANFESNPRAEILNLLGFNIEDVNKKFDEVVDTKNYEIYNNSSSINRIDEVECISNAHVPEKIVKPFKILTGDDSEGLITQALLMGNVKVAVELCLKAKRFADAIIIAMTGGSDLLMETQRKYLEECDGYVSSLISALITEDWTSLITNCDITCWKEALAAALTHAADEDLPRLCEQLGCRLESESQGNTKLLEEAQLCYICSGNLEKLVHFWGDKIRNSTNDLQELVEMITFLQKVIEKQGRQVQIPAAVSDVLCNYAMIVASQGNLQTALQFLGSTADEKMTSLKERLIVHLGQKPAYGQSLRHQVPQSVRKASLSTQPKSATSSFGVPLVNSAESQALQFGANPSFNMGVPGSKSAVSHTWQNSNAVGLVPRTFSPGPIVPPPANLSKQASNKSNQCGISASLPSRKYLLDPSVTTNQYENLSRNQPIGAGFNPQYGFTSTLNPISIPNTSPAPTPPMSNSISNVPNMSGYGKGFHSGSSFGQLSLGEEAMEPVGNISSTAPGWNDPPVPNKASRNQRIENPEPLEPITHPLFGVAPLQPQIPQMRNECGQSSITHPNQSRSSFNSQEPIPTLYQSPALELNAFPSPPTNFNPDAFNQNAVFPIAPHQAPTMQILEKPTPMPKVPIPEEHIHMKTVFDELKAQCICAANNPQMKRKLEDVGKKLETLYDMLREKKLSSNTLASLHQMVQMIQNGNYQGGLNLHTQLVSGPDFVQIANFMPGLKVLLQCALQMQVYLR